MLSQLCGMIQQRILRPIDNNPRRGRAAKVKYHIPGIMAFIEKPFYLAGVIDAINGVRDRNTNAKARFEISQARRIAADIKRR
jgi:hypothetical protein